HVLHAARPAINPEIRAVGLTIGDPVYAGGLVDNDDVGTPVPIDIRRPVKFLGRFRNSAEGGGCREADEGEEFGFHVQFKSQSVHQDTAVHSTSTTSVGITSTI